MSLPRVRHPESVRPRSRPCTSRPAIRCRAAMKVSERWEIRSSARWPRRVEYRTNFKGGIYDNAEHKLHWNLGSSVHRRVDDAARCQAVLRARRTGSGTRILARRDYRGWKDDLARRADRVSAPGGRF